MDVRRLEGFAAPDLSAKPAVAQKQEAAESLPKDSVKIGQDQGQPPGEDIQPIKPHKKWLFMSYIAADCNLVQYQMKNVDNQELVGSDDNTHIVAYLDVGPKPNPFDQTWQGARTYYVTKDDQPDKLASELIEEHGAHVDMSSPETLKKFIVDAAKKFPADNIAVILNDHGGGFTGAMADDSDGNFMSTPQLGQALKEASAELGKKIDIVGFDACLMAEAEVAYELKDAANILLASEENEGGPGWTYSPMLGQNIGTAIQVAQDAMSKKINVSPKEFAQMVVDVNAAHNNDIPTFSATDLTQMDKIKEGANQLAQAMIETTEKDAVRQAIQSAESYGGGWSPYGDIHDIHDMATKIGAAVSDEKLKKAAEDLAKTVKEVVFANESNPASHPKSEGLSIYAPVDSKSLGYNYGDLAFAKDSQWDEALQSIGIAPPQRKPSTPYFWPDGTPRKPKE